MHARFAHKGIIFSRVGQGLFGTMLVLTAAAGSLAGETRSEERRVGKECLE